jgi:Uncharacterised nucleotidyltransferase
MVATVQDVPPRVRVEMAHAHLQWVATAVDLPLLHIKGAALDERIRFPGREGSDADVLVRASDADRYLRALERYGWQLTSRFRNGSSFEHAATLRHEEFGWADVHRYIPGFTVDLDEAFEVLWADRQSIALAGRRCHVPSLPAQALVLILHAARSPQSGRAESDLRYAWQAADPELRHGVTELVERLDAHVGFAAATGRLDEYRSHPHYRLWKVASTGGTRLEEWWARVRAAPRARDAVVLLVRAPLVNRDHLAMVLWREPTTMELVKEFFARPIRGIRGEVSAWRRRRSRRSR